MARLEEEYGKLSKHEQTSSGEVAKMHNRLTRQVDYYKAFVYIKTKVPSQYRLGIWNVVQEME